MTIYNSNELNALSTSTSAGTPNPPYAQDGRIRQFKFTISTVSATVTGDSYLIGYLPAGAVVIGGRMDFGVAGVSVSGNIGTASTAALFYGPSTISAGGQADIANTLALNGLGSLAPISTNVRTPIYFKYTGAANPTSGTLIYGYMSYVVD